MDGAVSVLILNACVALLFAVAFMIIRISYPQLQDVTWFVAVYLTGMLTPISELAVHFSSWTGFFVATSYFAFLLSIVGMALGLAAIGRRPLPWRLAGAIIVAGVLIRIAIWGGHRDHLAYEFAFQFPFAAAAALSMATAVTIARRGGGRLWLTLAIVFGFMVAHFLTKPFFAAMLGSGTTAKAYIFSNYAVFSQATTGALMISAGLMVMLIVVQTAMGRTIQLSETDPLTGIGNRRGFERQSIQMMAEARLSGAGLAVVVFDLDHFKTVNDNYGHAVGDAVIAAFADLLRRTAPPTAAIARLGGEEFVLLLDRTTLHGAWHAAQAIRAAIGGLGAHLPAVTVSGGIAELQADDTMASLLQRADQWAYAAKTQGRNRICPPPLSLVAGGQAAAS